MLENIRKLTTVDENQTTDPDKQITDKRTRDERIRDAISSAEMLLREVKDIRDELDILQWITSYQDAVQKKLVEVGLTRSDQTTRDVLNDIIRMEQLASKVQEAVCCPHHPHVFTTELLKKFTVGQLNVFSTTERDSNH